MKFSVNLGQYYSNVDLKSISTEELLTRIGAQLGAVEGVVEYGPRYDGIVVVKVISCEKHPDADKLSVCLIDDGGVTESVERNVDGLVQVVCGAPNVKVALAVAWIPPGVVVPSTIEKDPFTLEVREIRGVKSNGMLASPAELAISDNHDGLLEITAEDVDEELTQPGTPFKKLYGLDDVVIDLENKMFTHRPDCFGNLGVARELAGIIGQKFEDPEWYWKKPDLIPASGIEFNVSNEHIPPTVTDLVPRFMAVAMSEVTVQKSPLWLQATLTRVGIKPINNVVDVTNYIMHLTGQPLHAFDYDKIKARSNQTSIFPRLSEKGEKLLLLGNKEVELTGEELVIATDKQAVALAGVMGGAETEVDENTKNIIIECATFDMYSIRRTSMRHGLFTDAVTRFTKGQSPLQNDRVIAYALKNMTELAGARQASDVFDIRGNVQQAYADQSTSGTLVVSAEFINQRLGSDISSEQICSMLQNVHFAAFTNDQGLLEITAPFWRMDIDRREDIVEEVGRLFGFHKLPVSLPSRPSKPAPRNDLFDTRQKVRRLLAAAGANEILSYSFVHGDLMRKTGSDPEKWAIGLRNAISPELQYYRTSLQPSLLEKIHSNLRSDMIRGDDNSFALFEIGRAHVKEHVDEAGLPVEFERLAVVFAADDKTAKKNYQGAAYYQAKRYLEVLVGNQVQYVPNETNDYPITAPYALGRSAMVQIGEQTFGVIGEFSESTKKSLKLPNFSAGFELDLSLFAQLIRPRAYSPLSAFPKTAQDITLEVDSDKTYESVRAALCSEVEGAADEHGYQFSIAPRDVFAENDSDKKRFTFRLWLTHPQKTLVTTEVNSFINTIVEGTKNLCGAVRI